MTATMFGEDYAGIQSLKITKGDLDPVTTPDDTLGAFLFNSKDTIQTRLNKFEITSRDASNGVFPVGASTANFQRYRYYYSQWYIYHYQRSFFPGLDFNIPLTDFVVKHPTSGFYLKGRHDNYVYDANQNTDVAYCRLQYPGSRYAEAGWKLDYRTSVASWDGAMSSTPYPALLHFANVDGNDGVVAFIPNTYTDVVVWNLPGNNEPLPAPLPAQSGQKSVTINNNGLRIAKPGYDVDIATDAQLAVSSNMRPTKIIAADDIAIPAGDSEYPLSVTIPENSICDVQYYTGAELVYPALPRQTPVGANWRLLPDRIQFQNNGIACRARFVIIVNDQVSQTVGDNEVFRQFEVNGENVVQFLRPGAGDPPAFSDIVIDSRWPALRILKEGYFEVGTGPQITNVPIDTQGYFPFIKFMVTTAGRTTGTVESYSGCVRPPTVSMSRLSSSAGWFETGDTTYAKVTADNVAFHTFRGRVKYYYWIYNSSSGWRLVTVYPDEVLGIRYYIFGIPKKDTP